jgi:hypothetical protein
MARTLAFPLAMVALFALTTSASSETAPSRLSSQNALLFATSHTDNRVLQSLGLRGSPHSTSAALACCKACRNTCISRNKTCHVGQGCACDG